ncbi:bulb-type lectin domain-containing protein [Tanacetum coccineum]
MASTTICMVTTKGYENLQLSSGPIVDYTLFQENDEAAEFVFDLARGLETITTYPYKHLEHSHLSWDNKKYRARGHPSKLPWGGDLYKSGSLRDFEKAKKHDADRNNEMYRHPRDSQYDKTANHSVLIVGIYVSADKAVDHYVEIKCSWGEKYGDKGFTMVSFDVLMTV